MRRSCARPHARGLRAPRPSMGRCSIRRRRPAGSPRGSELRCRKPRTGAPRRRRRARSRISPAHCGQPSTALPPLTRGCEPGRRSYRTVMRISLKGNQPSSSRGTANTFVEPANARAAAETVGWSEASVVVGFDVGGRDQAAVPPGEREQCFLRLFVRHPGIVPEARLGGSGQQAGWAAGVVKLPGWTRTNNPSVSCWHSHPGEGDLQDGAAKQRRHRVVAKLAGATDCRFRRCTRSSIGQVRRRTSSTGSTASAAFRPD